MTSEIKQRITQLNNGEIPSGYEKTEFGVFPCDWVTNKTLNRVCQINPKTNCLPNQFIYLDLGSVQDRKIIERNIIDCENAPSRAQRVLSKNDILYQIVRPYQKNNLFFNVEDEQYHTVASTGYALIRSKMQSYLFQIIHADYFVNQVNAKCTGTNYPAINSDDLGKVFIAYPASTEEQSKIAEILMKWDEAIELYNQLIEKLKQLKSVCLKKMFPQRGEKVPEWRFKGFTGAWEQRKVFELAEKTYGGGTPATSNEAFWNGNIPWIQSSDIVDGKLFGVEPRKHITQEGLNNSATQLVPENSIAIITRVGVGKLAFMPFPYTTSQDFLSLSKLNTEPFFTVYACYKKLQSELNAVQGTSIKGITKDELLAKIIMVPEYAEQQQIGAFFRRLDNLITLHQRKVDKIKAQQRVLQKYLLNGIIRV